MRSRSNRAVVTLLVAFGFTACHASPRPTASQPSRSRGAVTELRRDIDATLAAPGLAHGYWSVLARSLRTDETLYELNAHKLMMPASAAKILTLAAAAERLGWDFRYETEMFGLGRIESGTLDGDLLVVGSGDPGIVDRDGMAARLFESWAERLKAAGIRTITGRIIGDDNLFDDETVGFGWSWDDLAEGYAAGVSALQYNENRVQLTIAPADTVGAPATVTIAPRGSGLVVANRTTTGTEKAPSIELRRLPRSSRLELRGSVPLGSEPSVLAVSVENPTLFFVAALREALIDHGIDVRGPAVDIDDLSEAPLRRDGVSLATYRSPPLSVLMMAPFKFSLNLHEETLLKTMGAVAGAPTFKGGRAVVRSTLQQWGVPPGEFIQVDGSGLSRYNYATAEALVTTLVHVDRDGKLRGPFSSSLPIAGRDGTLSARMKGTAAEGNARAKTGAMSNVRTLAGYVTSADGEPLVFAIFANNFESAADVITGAIDTIVVRLADFRR